MGLGINIMIHQAGYKLPAYRLKKKDANHFESIGAGPTTGKEVVQMLILDKDVPSLGHRLHLLGIGAELAAKEGRGCRHRLRQELQGRLSDLRLHHHRKSEMIAA